MNRLFKLALVLWSPLFFAACDPLETDAGKDGDIIVVGNGILNLNGADGVIVDVATPTGEPESLVMNKVETQPLVRDKDSEERVATLFRWVAEGEQKDPVIRLDILEEEKKCRYFETLQNGDLVCRRDLEQLDIAFTHRPVFTARREVFYLDSQSQLVRLFDQQAHVLMDSVTNFVVDQTSMVWVERSSDPQRLLWVNGIQITEVGGESIENIQDVFVGSDGRMYFLLRQATPLHAAGLYQVGQEVAAQKLAAWDATLEVLESVADLDQKIRILRVRDSEGREKRLKLSPAGIEEFDPVSTTRVERPEAQASKMMAEGNTLLSSSSEGTQICRSIESSSSPICTSIEMKVGERLVDVLLKNETQVYMVIEDSSSNHHLKVWEVELFSGQILATPVAERRLAEKVLRLKVPTEKLGLAPSEAEVEAASETGSSQN